MIASVTTSQSNKRKNIGASMLNLFMMQKNEKMKKKKKAPFLTHSKIVK
jgi:hypothetical protein